MLYVTQIGDTQSPPPYTFPGVLINSFRLEVKLSALTAICDDLLNIGDPNERGFEFRPVFPFVDLEVLYYPKMEYGLFHWGGYVSQHECYVRFFVMKYVGRCGILFPDGEMAVFCPFLVVDNPWSAFAGRDVLGFPKLIGDFNPSPETSPFTTVSMEVFRDPPLRPQKSMVLPVVKIEPGAKAIKAPDRDWPWGGIDDVLLRDAERVLGKSLVFTPTFFECVQMKQFRDAMLPFEACYQAILQAVTFVEFSGNLADLPPAQVTLYDYGSFDLASRLGLPSGVPLTPISQYKVECSFSYMDVITLFTNGSGFHWCCW
jgi:hypothetical protein